MQTIYRLYKVTFRNGSTTEVRASSPVRASLAVSRTDGSDIVNMELVAVDIPMSGKAARTVARQTTGVSTRHMLATPARTIARYAMHPTSRTVVLDTKRTSDTVAVFKLGGAY